LPPLEIRRRAVGSRLASSASRRDPEAVEVPERSSGLDTTNPHPQPSPRRRALFRRGGEGHGVGAASFEFKNARSCSSRGFVRPRRRALPKGARGRLLITSSGPARNQAAFLPRGGLYLSRGQPGRDGIGKGSSRGCRSASPGENQRVLFDTCSRWVGAGASTAIRPGARKAIRGGRRI